MSMTEKERPNTRFGLLTALMVIVFGLGQIISMIVRYAFKITCIR